ncbi:MAG: lysoplasmalogenase [Vulcanimicrobiaceae bacterium]
MTMLGWMLLKPLPALLFAAWAFTARSEAPKRLGFGLLFAAIGDVLLLFPGNKFFIAGMVCFAIMHVDYIAAFAVAGTKGNGLIKRARWVSLPYIVAMLGFDITLWPYLGALRTPVIVYGFFLTAMAIAAVNLIGRIPLRNAILVASGAAIFMLSDTLLATSQFAPQIAPPIAAAFVLPTYYLAQTLIAFGIMDQGD